MDFGFQIVFYAVGELDFCLESFDRGFQSGCWRVGFPATRRAVLEARSYNNGAAWHRWFCRLAHRPTIDVWRVDALCLYFGEHISRFDPTYTAMGAR